MLDGTFFTPTSVAEVARKVRTALKRNFPGQVTRFSVRSSPALLRIRWCGGPVEEDVERVVNAVTSGTQIATVYVRWVPVEVPRAVPA
jgi:hypothetical protein